MLWRNKPLCMIQRALHDPDALSCCFHQHQLAASSHLHWAAFRKPRYACLVYCFSLMKCSSAHAFLLGVLINAPFLITHPSGALLYKQASCLCHLPTTLALGLVRSVKAVTSHTFSEAIAKRHFAAHSPHGPDARNKIYQCLSAHLSFQSGPTSHAFLTSL